MLLLTRVPIGLQPEEIFAGVVNNQRSETRSHDISSQDIPKFLLVPRLIQMKPTASDAHVAGAILVAFSALIIISSIIQHMDRSFDLSHQSRDP
ncbi:hypothetical protein CBS63078_9157 [Aspergillus niger]|nr:hypothetical protein CBS115989_8826 [Aspergillus niger]KAI2841633.1 hypothetical protein CBS11232_8738 [Aspergillus niger]KAI2850457.1 hypothetical protein CBS11350_1759 [Aspergillus niger]KAI2870108.1 hypothetical protein CBS115988_9556 [Aspergillus niger]KAI2891403.1 hypothetical protein CBS13152_5179 [Aspergillus niger]